MAIIQVLTFKGCQTTVDFMQQLADLAKKRDLDFEVDVITVPTLEKAEENGLYGSPTILINGEEYQKNPSAKPGFYWRSYQTTDGIRPFPLPDEIVAALELKTRHFTPVKSVTNIYFPTLLTGEWWPFSLTASSFWSEVAEDVGIEIIIVNIESEEGAMLKNRFHLSGVPCLLISPDKIIYGVQLNYDDAKKLLQKLVTNDRWNFISRIQTAKLQESHSPTCPEAKLL